MKSCHLQQHGWTWGYYAKWNKSHRERKMPYDITLIWNLKNKTKWKQTHKYREQMGDSQRGFGGEGESGRGLRDTSFQL